jgi:hypothetical protein
VTLQFNVRLRFWYVLHGGELLTNIWRNVGRKHAPNTIADNDSLVLTWPPWRQMLTKNIIVLLCGKLRVELTRSSRSKLRVELARSSRSNTYHIITIFIGFQWFKFHSILNLMIEKDTVVQNIFTKWAGFNQCVNCFEFTNKIRGQTVSVRLTVWPYLDNFLANYQRANCLIYLIDLIAQHGATTSINTSFVSNYQMRIYVMSIISQ